MSGNEGRTFIVGVGAALLLSSQVGLAEQHDGLSAVAQEDTQVQGEEQSQELATSTEAEASDASPRLGVVLVTSQRREENLQDVPVAITALSEQVLSADQSIKTANDITQYIPNAQAPATDGRTRPRWFLRGIGTNETAATTVSPIGIYQDEVYLNNVYIQGFPLFDSERVEVLRGPQGTLWGKNTTGGAINFISKKPTFDTEGYFRIGGGSFNEKTFQGAVGGALVPDKLAARVSFYDESRDGWVSNVAGGPKRGAVSDQALRAQLLWQINDDLDALLAVRKRDLLADKSPSFYFLDPPDSGGLANPALEGPLSRNAVAQSGRSEDDLETEGASLHVNWRLGENTLTSITGYDSADRTLWNGSDLSVQIARSRATTESEQFTQEFRLSSPKDQTLSWIVGAYWFKENVSVHSATRNDPVPGMGANPANPSRFRFQLVDVSQETESYALFASTDFRFNDSWSLKTGVRYSYEEKDYGTRLRSAPNGAQFLNGNDAWWQPGSVSALNPAYREQQKDDWSEVTYDLTPQWRVNDNLNLYFRYARGFRAGGFVEADAVITKLDQEVLDSYELGFKSQWQDGRLTVNGALFYYDYSDIIVGVLLPVPGTSDTRQVQENAASGYSRGLELETTWAPSNGIRLGGSFGWLQTEYEDYFSSASGQAIDANGNRFTRAPEFSVTLFGEYVHRLGNGSEVGVGTDWSWRDRQYYNAVNQDNPQLWQDAYALGNARLFWRDPQGRIQVTGFVRNVTDETYSVLSTGPSGGRTRQVYGLPRSFGVSLDWNFF